MNFEEKQRYSRQIQLKNIGEQGQQLLKNAKVLIVGAGGLGCPILLYLSAAGVGEIGIVDDDVVDVSNLQRQILYTHLDIGQPKVLCAQKAVEQQNPFTKINAHNFRLEVGNALELLNDYDLIIDGSDNFSTRYLINDACVLLNKPFVFGSILDFEGQLSVFNYQNSATYRCVFPTPPKKTVLNCAENGVLGVLPGVIGTYQATEALKIILNLPKVLSSQLKVIDLLNNTSYSVNVSRDEEAVQLILKNGLLKDYSISCSIDNVDEFENDVKQISSIEANNLLNDQNVLFLDVRPQWQAFEIPCLNYLWIDLNDFLQQKNSIPTDKKIITCCENGITSIQAAQYLSANNKSLEVFNLERGLLEFFKLIEK